MKSNRVYSEMTVRYKAALKQLATSYELLATSLGPSLFPSLFLYIVFGWKVNPLGCIDTIFEKVRGTKIDVDTYPSSQVHLPLQ